MSYKKCNSCEENKVLNLFGKDSSKKDGLRTICKNCSSISKKISYEKNKENILLKQKNVYEKNKEYYLNYAKNNRENKKEYNKEYLSKWRQENQDKIKGYNKSKYHEDKDYSKSRVKEWRAVNADHCKKYSRDYINNRLENDSVFKIKHNTRTLIRGAFKRNLNGSYVKSQKTEDILGCSMDFFIEHISGLFSEGMFLSNHGEWHIDHIIPLASADTQEDVVKLNHYTNLQPLWAIDNLSKGKKIL